MRFDTPLLPGRLVRRYKRFMADVVLEDGREVTAHTPNSGSMMGVSDPGSRVWLSPADSPTRKLKFTLEIVEADGTLVGVNTGHPNRLVAEAAAEGAIPELAGYPETRREVRYGKNSRIDVLLSGSGRPPCYVEVKNVTLARGTGEGRAALFPDAVTARGAKHLAELADRVAAGERAVMVYLVQRDDCHRFQVAEDIDPAYLRALTEARAAGVEAIAYACTVKPDMIVLSRPLPVG
ncbi:DNA/RNA nuclease SfsA [Roseospirillum parvum]|uniref:Sugar fermentation stimulation protein homolog n=1 Tax=Roseospirillum parvum TaxID=83401 RepID=A0A1G7VZ14_9PROT|nr:DNA/RNA nuclease SfsA [Roseospirillum parvum]SDG64689.1 sugar fermentation stimulation protein A [Roseospirillum parvum]